MTAAGQYAAQQAAQARAAAIASGASGYYDRGQFILLGPSTQEKLLSAAVQTGQGFGTLGGTTVESRARYARSLGFSPTEVRTATGELPFGTRKAEKQQATQEALQLQQQKRVPISTQQQKYASLIQSLNQQERGQTQPGALSFEGSLKPKGTIPSVIPQQPLPVIRRVGGNPPQPQRPIGTTGAPFYTKAKEFGGEIRPTRTPSAELLTVDTLFQQAQTSPLSPEARKFIRAGTGQIIPPSKPKTQPDLSILGTLQTQQEKLFYKKQFGKTTGERAGARVEEFLTGFATGFISPFVVAGGLLTRPKQTIKQVYEGLKPLNLGKTIVVGIRDRPFGFAGEIAGSVAVSELAGAGLKAGTRPLVTPRIEEISISRPQTFIKSAEQIKTPTGVFSAEELGIPVQFGGKQTTPVLVKVRSPLQRLLGQKPTEFKTIIETDIEKGFATGQQAFAKTRLTAQTPKGEFVPIGKQRILLENVDDRLRSVQEDVLRQQTKSGLLQTRQKQIQFLKQRDIKEVQFQEAFGFQTPRTTSIVKPKRQFFTSPERKQAFVPEFNIEQLIGARTAKTFEVEQPATQIFKLKQITKNRQLFTESGKRAGVLPETFVQRQLGGFTGGTRRGFLTVEARANKKALERALGFEPVISGEKRRLALQRFAINKRGQLAVSKGQEFENDIQRIIGSGRQDRFAQPEKISVNVPKGQLVERFGAVLRPGRTALERAAELKLSAVKPLNFRFLTPAAIGLVLSQKPITQQKPRQILRQQPISEQILKQAPIQKQIPELALVPKQVVVPKQITQQVPRQTLVQVPRTITDVIFPNQPLLRKPTLLFPTNFGLKETLFGNESRGKLKLQFKPSLFGITLKEFTKVSRAKLSKKTVSGFEIRPIPKELGLKQIGLFSKITSGQKTRFNPIHFTKILGGKKTKKGKKGRGIFMTGRNGEIL